MEYAPLIGYYPRANKSWFFVVKEHLFEEVQLVFADSNVRITAGHKYLGGFVGSTDGQKNYVGKKKLMAR